jgi:hypothetical protein
MIKKIIKELIILRWRMVWFIHGIPYSKASVDDLCEREGL